MTLDAKTVGRIIDEHYRARLAADPTGPRVHECGAYCGSDIAERLSSPPATEGAPDSRTFLRIGSPDWEALDKDRPGLWVCVCGVGWFGTVRSYPDDLRAHAVFRVESGEPGAAHDPGLAAFRPDRPVLPPADDTERLRRIELLIGLARPSCSQCGQSWERWACGPTHALARNALGIEWDGIEPGLASQDRETT